MKRFERKFCPTTSVLKPIRSAADHEAAMDEVAPLWGAKAGTPDGDRLDALATLIDAWEAENCPMDPPDRVDAMKFRMEQQGMTGRAVFTARKSRR